jgi:bacillopeptidase F (M6 metalloprotease family)
MDFDLSAYAGQDVLIGLRYVTDWATVYEGWYVEDTLTVSGAHVEFEPFYPEADFMVSLVVKTTYSSGYEMIRVNYMWLQDATEFGALAAMGTSNTEVWLVVSPIMEEGFVDYKFKNMRAGWPY